MHGLRSTLDSEPMGIGGIYDSVVVARSGPDAPLSSGRRTDGEA